MKTHKSSLGNPAIPAGTRDFAPYHYWQFAIVERRSIRWIKHQGKSHPVDVTLSTLELILAGKPAITNLIPKKPFKLTKKQRHLDY